MQSQSHIMQTLKAVTEKIEAYRLQLSTLPDFEQEKMICVFNQNKPSFEMALKNMAFEYQDFPGKLNDFLYSDLMMLTQYDVSTDKFVINEMPDFSTELLPMVSNTPTQAQMNAFGFYNEEERSIVRANKRVRWCKQKYSQILKKHIKMLNENEKLSQENISFFEKYCRKIIENKPARELRQNIFSEILETTLMPHQKRILEASLETRTFLAKKQIEINEAGRECSGKILEHILGLRNLILSTPMFSLQGINYKNFLLEILSWPLESIQELTLEQYWTRLQEASEKIGENRMGSPNNFPDVTAVQCSRLLGLLQQKDTIRELALKIEQGLRDCSSSLSFSTVASSSSSSSPSSNIATIGSIAASEESGCSPNSLNTNSEPSSTSSVSVSTPPSVIFSTSPKLKKVTPAFEGKTDFEIITSIIQEFNLPISECGCVSMLNRSEFPENNARDYIAELLIQILQEKEWPKEREIIITDIGSGELKQAATIACALVKEGYSIKFNFVDSEYTDKQKSENRITAFKKISTILNENFSGNVSVNGYSYRYNATQHQSDFLLVIDDIFRLTDPLGRRKGQEIYDNFCLQAKAKNPAVICIATKQDRLRELKVIYDDKVFKQYAHQYKPMAMAVGKR